MNLPYNSLLWFVAQFLQISILVALYKRNWLGRFSAFTAYIMLHALSDPFLELAKGRWPYIYYFGFWGTLLTDIALTAAILYQVARQVWSPFDGGRALVRKLMWVAVALLVIQSAIFLWTSAWQFSKVDPITGLFLLVDNDVRIVTCGVGLFVLLFRKRLAVSWRDFAVGLLGGFVLFSAAHIMVAAAMPRPTVLHRSTLAEINSAAYVLATLIWLAYSILSPNVAVGGSTGSTPGISVPGGRGYAFREVESWWSRLRLKGFSS